MILRFFSLVLLFLISGVQFSQTHASGRRALQQFEKRGMGLLRGIAPSSVNPFLSATVQARVFFKSSQEKADHFAEEAIKKYGSDVFKTSVRPVLK